MVSRFYLIGLSLFFLSGNFSLQGQELEEIPVPRIGMVSYFHSLGKEFAALGAALPQKPQGRLDFYMLLSKTGQVQEIRLKHKAYVTSEFLENFLQALREAPAWLPGKNSEGEVQDTWICFSVEWKCYGDTIRFIPVQYPPRHGLEAHLARPKE